VTDYDFFFLKSVLNRTNNTWISEV